MSNLLFSALGYIALISVVVAIHEWGHYIVARRFRVAVERFSIGMGPVIKRWPHKGAGEIALSILPLGGYVKFTEATPAEGNILVKDAAPWQRLLIAAAGPAINLVTAVVFFVIVGAYSGWAWSTLVATVDEGGPAAEAGMRTGAYVTAVNGVKVTAGVDVEIALLRAAIAGGDIAIDLQYQGALERLSLASTAIDLSAPEDAAPLHDLGFRMGYNRQAPLALAATPVGAPDLKADDIVTHIDGIPVPTFASLDTLDIKALPATIPLIVERDGVVIETDLIRTVENSQNFKLLGILPKVPFDWVEIPGHSVLDPASWWRATLEVGDMMAMTGQALMGLLSGRLGPEVLSGPVQIAAASGDVAEASVSAKSLRPVIYLLGAVSVAIAVFNLLPIPMLDGGQMLMAAIEQVRGKELSKSAQSIALYASIVVMACFVMVALYSDARFLIRALG